MDYEKAYNEAIERAKQFMSEHPTRAEADLMVALFPELKESEDERIRTRLLEYFHGFKDSAECPVFWEGLNIDNILTWLENQKESLHIPEMCKENADSFTDEYERIREFLIDLLSHGTWKKDWPFSPAECVAWLEKQKDINCLACDEHLKGYLAGRKVTEEKQKELPFVKDVVLGYPGLYFYDGERMHFRGSPAMEENQKEQKPVEIHIDNPNIEKFAPDMKITTSDSSADGDELLYVCNKSYKIGYRDGKRDAERKPAEYIPDSVKFSEGYKTGREVGFREGVESVKPAEWSERDEEMLEYVIDDVNDAKQLFATKDAIELCDKEIAWLKSLPLRCPKSTDNWKPSKEQLPTS